MHNSSQSLFFTSSVLEHILEQCNRYAAECKGEQFQTWQPITVEELCAYLGFMLLVGILRLPCFCNYWKDMMYDYVPVADRISQDQFCNLHRYLHFADNCTLSPQIAPIIVMLRGRFAAVWNPGKNISIDKAMIPYKGRSSLKQYKTLKPIKQGIKKGLDEGGCQQWICISIWVVYRQKWKHIREVSECS